MRVVIVEDEGITALFLKESVEELGHEVVGSFCDAQGLYAYLETDSAIDIVLMDILINGSIDGIQASVYLRKKYPTIKIVYITSYKDSQTIQSAHDSQPNGYLIKPVSKSDLEAHFMVMQTDMKKSEVLIEEPTLTIGRYRYCKNDNLIYNNDELVKLSAKERSCLALLIKNINSYVTNENLISAIWKGEDNNGGNSLRELVYRLRKKLPELVIESTPSIGYILRAY